MVKPEEGDYIIYTADDRLDLDRGSKYKVIYVYKDYITVSDNVGDHNEIEDGEYRRADKPILTDEYLIF